VRCTRNRFVSSRRVVCAEEKRYGALSSDFRHTDGQTFFPVIVCETPPIDAHARVFFIATKRSRFSSESVCERTFRVTKTHSSDETSRCIANVLCGKCMCFDQVVKSAIVCIRIWCWFMIDHKKVHSSTYWKLEVGGRPWPRPFFFPG
jgi:hypothetical protein